MSKRKNNKRKNRPESRTIYPQKLRHEFTALLISNERLWEERDQPGGYEMPLVTAMTIAAFGCEIGLKYLIAKERGCWFDEHKLRLLFKELHTSTRDDIRLTIGMNNSTIQERLIAANNAFVEWRYFFERDEKKISAMTAEVVFVRSLLKTLDTVINRRYPFESETTVHLPISYIDNQG